MIKIYELMGRPDLARFLHVVETPSKLNETEFYWELICKELGWVFISHKPKPLYLRLLDYPDIDLHVAMLNRSLKPWHHRLTLKPCNFDNSTTFLQ